MFNLSATIQSILGQWREEEGYIIEDVFIVNNKIQTIRKNHVGRLQRKYKGTFVLWRKNNLVPGHTDYIRQDKEAVLINSWGKYEVNYNWPENGGFVDKPHETYLCKGDMFDRIGDEKGRYVCRIISEHRVSVDERALPYYLIAGTVEEEPAYHCYRVIRDFSELGQKVENLTGELEAIKDSYRKIIQEGTASASFGKTGGGNQLRLPLNIEDLLVLNFIEEIIVEKNIIRAFAKKGGAKI